MKALRPVVFAFRCGAGFQPAEPRPRNAGWKPAPQRKPDSTLRRLALTALLVAWLAPLPCAMAQKLPPLPKDLPSYGPLVPFTTPNVTVTKLPNGLTVWRVPRPGFPKVALALAVRGGRAYDPKDQPGLSDLLMAVMDQGTKTRSAKQIAEAFEAAGGDLAAICVLTRCSRPFR